MNPVLIDENLPQSLAHFFGKDAAHVTTLGPRMSDDALWNFARESAVIVTKDADFFDRHRSRNAAMVSGLCALDPQCPL